MFLYRFGIKKKKLILFRKKEKEKLISVNMLAVIERIIRPSDINVPVTFFDKKRRLRRYDFPCPIHLPKQNIQMGV